ncbi:hypothetical protein GCM10008090_01210 [Arenicella chitinivorans]|uniref:Uncharacterized protein n=1 Tax=Arenicella chitinivorans TaxID=1329800 RepID=A0A918VHB7_9GAMM|nr:hypothetical protein [Arenicella chitinivorans]GGZ96733.1 hypothetical protein GCM10008090_01210 [Arenicella chitinivorans]
MKPLKERLKIYKLIVLVGIGLTFILLLAGYDYSKSKGFYPSTERKPLNFTEALTSLPTEFIWFLLVLFLIVFVVELFVSIFKK